MKIFKTLKIGEFHDNYCEDFLVIEQISSTEKLIAVLDGCTMGTESVFASILTGKILRKISKELYYSEFKSNYECDLDGKLKIITEKLFNEIIFAKNHFGLEINELLTTLIIGLIDEETSKCEFLAFGDGLIIYDENKIEYEQGDKPDYFAYHQSEVFDNWYSKQSQRLSIDKFKNLAIATDGIFAFKNLHNPKNQKAENEIISYLLDDMEYFEHTNFLERKLKILADTYKHIPTDDIAIIRIINR